MRTRSLWQHAWIIPVLLSYWPASIQSCETNQTYREVSLQPVIISLAKVDGVEQIFVADFYLTAMWLEPDAMAGELYRIDRFWNPHLEFINVEEMTKGTTDGSKTSLLSDTPWTTLCNMTDDDATAAYAVDSNRFSGRFTAHLEMRDFPKDTQILKLWMESALWDETTLRFRMWRGNETYRVSDVLPPDVQVIGWEILYDQVAMYTTTHEYPPLTPSQGRQQFSRFVIEIPVRRSPEFIMNKIVVPTCLLVIMAISLFVLEASQSDRLMGTISIFCGMISILFVAAQFTPAVPYETRLDRFMSFSFCIITVILIVQCITYAARPEQPKLKVKSRTIKSPSAVLPRKRVSQCARLWRRICRCLYRNRHFDMFCLLLFLSTYAIGVAVIFNAGSL